MKSKSIINLSVILLSLVFLAQAQVNQKALKQAEYYFDHGGEVYFSFDVQTKSAANQFTRMLSIDNLKGNTVLAYANRKQFDEFLKLGLDFQVLTHPGDLLINPPMATSTSELALDWDKYPTYEVYVAAMNEFQAKYPDICKIIKIGKSSLGRDLLYAKISDNVNTKEAEPRHMYTSAMHGDETVMYVNFLRLIDYLLSRYATDNRVKNIVNSLEIWICPLENPDGTYQTGNSTVAGARRFSSLGTDLNRHYPLTTEPASSFTNKEPEAKAVMQLVDTLDFNLSVNVHGGAELLNYPYDFANVIHPDENWMVHVYKQWADTVHAIASNIMSQQNNGIVRGFVWYQVFGSRMDYFTFHKNMREVTFEGSATKLLPAAQIPEYWNYYYKSLLNYMEQNLYGINGTVTSSVSGAGIKAKMTVLTKDNAQSVVYSKLPHGDFWRPYAAGTFDVEFSASGYQPFVAKNVIVNWDKATVLNIKLTPIGSSLEYKSPIQSKDLRVIPFDGQSLKITFNGKEIPTSMSLQDLSGKTLNAVFKKSSTPIAGITWDGTENGRTVANGIYVLRMQTHGKSLTHRIALTR